MLTDPTSGVGYAFGEVLPSADMTTIANQQPNALDAAGGGTYSALAGNVSLAGSAARTWLFGTDITVSFTEQVALNGGATIPDGEDVVWAGATLDHLPQVGARVYRFNVPLVPLLNDSDRFSWSTAGAAWDQSDITSQGGLHFAMAGLPAAATGWTMRDVTAWVDGAGGGAGAHPTDVPATMPAITVRRINHSQSLAGVIGTATDPSVNLAQYDIRHGFSVEEDGSGAMTDDPDDAGALTSSYYVAFAGEASTNSQANSLRLRGIDCEINVTAIGP